MRLAAAEAVDRADYGRFPERIEWDWLGRWCHLSEADVALARRRAGDVTRLGFAAQLVTVRAIGTFLADPAAVPDPVVASVAHPSPAAGRTGHPARRERPEPHGGQRAGAGYPPPVVPAHPGPRRQS